MLRLLPAAGVIVMAPVLMSEGVETDADESSFVAESVSVEKVRSASSCSMPAVPPESVVYVAAPRMGVTNVGVFANASAPVPVSSDTEVSNCRDVTESVLVP